MKKIYNEDQLPLFEFIIDEEDDRALSKVALTANPAIEVKGKYFSKEVEYKMFSDDEKQIIAGPAMIPNIKIKRKDENGNMYLGYFSKETICKMVEIFNKNLKDKPQGVINDEHSETMVDAYIVGSWIVEDSYYDKSRFYGYDLPVGTWFMEVKVDDPQFWTKGVKEEGKYGFSIEGIMDILFKGRGDRFNKVKDVEKDENEWFSVLKEIGWLNLDDDFLDFLEKFGGPGSGRHPEGGGDDEGGSSLSQNASSAEEHENKTADLDHEEGAAFIGGKKIDDIVQSTGQNNVKFNGEKLKSFTGDERLKMTITHNHPAEGGSFSPEDIAFAHNWGIGELRAVDKDYTYSIKYDGPAKNTWEKKDINRSKKILKDHTSVTDAVINKKRQDLFAKFPSKASEAEKTKWYADTDKELKNYYQEASHEAMQQHAKKYGFTYTRTKRK